MNNFCLRRATVNNTARHLSSKWASSTNFFSAPLLYTNSGRCSSSSNTGDSSDEIFSRLDNLERVVSNLAATLDSVVASNNSNMIMMQQQQHQQQQQHGSDNNVVVTPPSASSSPTSEFVAPNNSNTNSNNNRSVVAPELLRSVTKVYSSILSPNAHQPWQVKALSTSTGTAFVVDRKNKLLLTNAHVVAFASLVEVRRHGEARRFVAECVFISGDCDLALLEVVDEGFWSSHEGSVVPSFFLDSSRNYDERCNNSSNDDNSSSSSSNNNSVAAAAAAAASNQKSNSSSSSSSSSSPIEALAQLGHFDGFPDLQRSVNVVGFPLGGDQISITSGVVSRIDQTPYSTSGLRIASIQLDAAINPGNSGGPALCDGKVVGVAFQSLVAAEGIGYIIPNCVVAHFVRAYLLQNKNSNDDTDADHAAGATAIIKPTTKLTTSSGYHSGFPAVGLYFQELANPSLREHFQLPKDANGFLVEKLIGGSPNSDRLKPGDIIMRVDDRQIERDITIEWRAGERIQFTHLIHMRNPGDKMLFHLWRDKRACDVEVDLKVPAPLVYPHLINQRFLGKPQYCVYCGCVFTVLTVPFLEAWGNQWPTHAPRDLVNQFTYGEVGVAPDGVTEVVVLAQILPHAVNRGYGSESFANRTVKDVNGVAIKNFRHFVETLKTEQQHDVSSSDKNHNKDKDHIQITMMDGRFPLTMVLPNSREAKEADAFLCATHGISSAAIVS